ncbi:MAG: hypothetical protein KDI79_12255 [Anaerolineae bacterium]|nr:hypothetical protein [Anaerolineae bacterium]
MTHIVMPVSPTEKADRLQVSVHIEAEVLSAEAARREANYWLLENVGNLLRTDNPELVLGEQLVWRVDIVLTSPTRGQVGAIGRLELDAITGKVLADETLAEELTPCAHALMAN